MDAVVGDDQPIRGDAIARVLAVAGFAVRAQARSFEDAIGACLLYRPVVALIPGTWPIQRTARLIRSSQTETLHRRPCRA